MGYYTRHELEIIYGNDYKTDYEAEIRNFSDYYPLFGDSVKWYDCEKDMKEYSKKYPSTLFLITGEGEETGDMWKMYVKNGKSITHKAIISYEEFKESLLK